MAGGGGLEESTFDPTVPPEKQIVTYRTKEGEIRKVTKLELQDQLQASEKLMDSLNQTWEEKMATTQAIHQEREKALEEMGISIDKNVGHSPELGKSLAEGQGGWRTRASEASFTGQLERGPPYVGGARS